MPNELFDNLYKMASLMEENEKNTRKYGTADQPAVIRSDKPLFAKWRGYEQRTYEPSDEILLDSGGTVKPENFWVKPAVPGRMGTDMAQALLPYAASTGKDPDDITADIRLLATDPKTSDLDLLSFGSKKTNKMVTITSDIARAMKTAGIEVEEGEIYAADEYRNLLNTAKLGLSAQREKRMRDKAPAEQEGQNLTNRTKKAALTAKEAEAKLNAEIADRLAADTPAPTKKSKHAENLEKKFLK